MAISKKKNKKKKTNFFQELLGKKLSILIDHFKPKSNLKESYVGFLIGKQGRFWVLSTVGFNNRIDYIAVHENHIISVWVYKD